MKKLVILTLIILTVGLIPLFFHFDVLYGCDLAKQQIPFILETKRLLSSGIPFWSWNTFMGESFVGAYSFYTFTSPFVWFMCLFPAKYVLLGGGIALYIKVLCTAIFSFLFFKKLKQSENLCILGALLYTFSSFYICNLYYFHFCEPIMMFPLLLIAIENVLEKKKRCYFYLAIASFGVIFINFYFALSSFILGLIYLLVRSYCNRILSFKLIFKSCGSVLIGILIDCVILLPTILYISGTARAAGTHSSAAQSLMVAIFDIITTYVPRILSLMMPSITESGINDSIFGYYGFTSLHGFITVFGAFTILWYIFKYRDWLQKLLIILLIFYLTPLNGIFSGFTAGNYARWLYGLVLFGSLATTFIIERKEKIKTKWIWLYSALAVGLFIFLVAVSYLFNIRCGENFYLSPVRNFEIGLFIVNIICLFAWFFYRNKVALTIAMVCVCSSLNFYAFSYNLRNDSIGAEDLIKRDIQRYSHGELLLNTDLTDTLSIFEYRTDYVRSPININILNGTPGIYGHHSVFNKHLLPFRKSINKGPGQPLFSCDIGNRQSVSALTSVKQVVDYQAKLDTTFYYSKESVVLRNNNNNCDIYDFKYYIPMGFSYDSFVTTSDLHDYLNKNDSVDIAALMLGNIVISDEDINIFQKYLRKGIIAMPSQLDSIVSQRRKNVVDNFVGTSAGFTATTDFDQPQVIFFSVAHDPGFVASIDDKPVKTFNANLGMTAIMVPPGSHTIEFKYTPPGLIVGLYISLLGIVLLVLLYFSPSFSTLLSKRKTNTKIS